MYRRLTAPVLCLLAVVTAPALAQSQPSCPFSPVSSLDGVLIGYTGNVRQTIQAGVATRVGSFRPLGILREGALIASDGAVIHDEMELWRVLDPSAAAMTLQRVSSFLDRLGEDHCVYHAELAEAVADWTLLSSRPLPGVFESPSAADRAYFAEHTQTCVAQGDRSDPQLPCSGPELLAVSDIDGDGMAEYWATEPYIWDTGVSVWQREDEGLSRIFTGCTGCSD